MGQVSTFTGSDVGVPLHAGSVINNGNGSYTINGGGNDIYVAADNFFYYYGSVTGLVWEAKMQVVSFDGPDIWSKVGLMVRRPNGVGTPPATDDPEIMNLTTRAAGRNDTSDQHRPTRGVNTTDHQNLGPNGTSFPNTAPNMWLRITRTNAFFTLSYGTTGTTWTNYSSFSVFDTSGTANGFDGTVWENPILLGVAVTAHNDADTNGKIESTESVSRAGESGAYTAKKASCREECGHIFVVTPKTGAVRLGG